jgi:hypothetical protein
VKQKHGVTPYRSLVALERGGSTTRVLNLAVVALTYGHLREHREAPFFKAPLLNRAIVLKHRMRSDDPMLLSGPKGTATKVIIPFDPQDLTSGGAAFFVGENGWDEILEELCDGQASLQRDKALLELLDELPSFDPFLLREQLRRDNFRPADCYFAISSGDRDRMRKFVEAEIAPLIARAYSSQKAAPGGSSRLVDILLSHNVDERLDPLRKTLRLEGESYREGIFCWKGFLYYKWALGSLLEPLRDVIVEVGRIQVSDRADGEVEAFVAKSRARLQDAVQDRCRDISAILDTYDAAFSRLTRDNDPIAFRDFLLAAPALFPGLGERIGMIAHVASFWRYRFPVGSSFRISSDEVLDLLQDFETGLATPVYSRAA